MTSASFKHFERPDIGHMGIVAEGCIGNVGHSNLHLCAPRHFPLKSALNGNAIREDIGCHDRYWPTGIVIQNSCERGCELKLLITPLVIWDGFPNCPYRILVCQICNSDSVACGRNANGKRRFRHGCGVFFGKGDDICLNSEAPKDFKALICASDEFGFGIAVLNSCQYDWSSFSAFCVC